MEEPADKISFEKLTELVIALTTEQKQSLMGILRQENQFVVEEAAVAYLKSSEVPFEKKWEQSISAKEFEKLAHENIHRLPWK